jgi:MFS family permease
MYEGIERDRVMGWRGSAQSFGGVLWPLLGGALGGLSWRLPFAVYMLAIPIGLLAIFAVPESRSVHQAGSQSHDGRSVLAVFKESPVLLVIYGLIFSANVLLYVIVIFLPQLLETFGISSSFQIGLFITAMTGSAGAIAFVYGGIRSRLSYPTIAMIAVALWSAALVSIAQASSTRIIALSVALFGISHGLVLPTVMVWVGEAVPLSFRGRFSSYLGTFGFIGQFLSPIIFMPILIFAGLKGVFLIAASVGVAWFFLLAFVFLKSVNNPGCTY